MQNGVTVIRESRGAKDAYELRAADLFYVKQNDDPNFEPHHNALT